MSKILSIIRHAILFGTLEGSLGCIIPIEEIVFKRLYALQNKMIGGIYHFAGLNPKSYRYFF